MKVRKDEPKDFNVGIDNYCYHLIRLVEMIVKYI